jgi:hypothetical protein
MIAPIKKRKLTIATFISKTSLWNIDLGRAVTGVTRRRDGFRNSSDERSNGCGDLPRTSQARDSGTAEKLISRGSNSDEVRNKFGEV